jgi:hypothetical protein
MNNRARPQSKREAVRLRIHSPEDFAAVVKKAITDRSRFPSVSAAARQAGLLQPTLWRLSRSPGQFVDADVYSAVLTLLTPDEQIVLDEKVWTSESFIAYSEYKEWLAEQEAEAAWDDPLVRLLVTRVETEVPHVYNEWNALFAAGDYHESRRLIAMLRIVVPLVEARNSGGVERWHTDLSTSEFRRFIDAGWQREKILLNRGSDAARVQAQG